MSEMKKMTQLIKTRPDFLEYITIQRRKDQLYVIDEKIKKLKQERQRLNDTPLYCLKREECLPADHFCQKNNWNEKDLNFFIGDFEKTNPRSKPKVSKIMSSVSKLGDALFLA